jgi:phosphonopyruvate hydrolase
MIGRAGFDFVWASGFCVSASYGLPDASILSMKHFVEEARAMNEAVTIPILFDGDTGYGNAVNVIYLTRILEEAGIAAMCLEDKRFPKDTSLLAGGRQELLDPIEFAGKIKAAKDTQKNEDFTVVARTEALIAGMGQEEAIKRATLYAEAGADCIFIHSKSKAPDEIIEFVNSWKSPVPLVLVPTSYPDLTEDKIEALGKVKVIIYANQVLRAAVKASQEVLAEIKLRFVGAHLGSLEWSVDELAKRLDRFPNMAVDMAERISHLQYKAVTDWQKVHDFFIKYQDRLIYATDQRVDSTQIPSQRNTEAHESWLRHWKFFTSDEKMKVPKVEKEFKGLKLPREVVDKIYRKNAEKWFPEMAKLH